MEFRVWLGNPWELWYDWSKLVQEVAKLFKPAVALNEKYNSVAVQSRYVKPAVQDHDLLVYVVPAPEYGFIGRPEGFGPEGSDADRETGGLTLPWGGLTCSEVYVGNVIASGPGAELKVEALKDGAVTLDEKRPPEYLAKLIYHEALHNKTGMGEHDLHKRGGLARSPVERSAELTGKNTELMAKYLGKKRPQWALGWQGVA